MEHRARRIVSELSGSGPAHLHVGSKSRKLPRPSSHRELVVHPPEAGGQTLMMKNELHQSGSGGLQRSRRTHTGDVESLFWLTPKPDSMVNVCGGQCCHGWSKTAGSQRCTQPNCVPQCQNGGMCLRPQLCVCKPGSKGKACEQTTVPGNGHTNENHVVPQRPLPQQALPNGFAPAPPSANNMAQMKLTVKAAPQFVRPHYIQQHIQIRTVPMHPGQQYVIKPKYYHTHTQTHVQARPERPIPLAVGHNPVHVGNHTGRIKVVFTPTICKVTCIGSRCHNSCEKGNTTTIISENGRTTDTLTAPNFRVVVCHLPCINGGTCSARDKCQCPPNFAGKFCQMAVQNGHQQQQMSTGYGFNPGIVNIHIKHPPEASVQVHQVYQHTESSQKIQHHGYTIMYPNQHGHHLPHYQPVTSKSTLGRCFQETVAGQCGKVLPGLTKQEQCCGTIGTSWGFHKCQKCPQKPSILLIDCPLGYKRVNNSQCQDVDECQLQGVCANGNCLNTVGGYRCTCKPGYVPHPSLTACISSAPAVQEEKGACFRLVSSGRQCLHPVSAQLSKQLCCCSVGKAWGPHCDKCPPPGTGKSCKTVTLSTCPPHPPLPLEHSRPYVESCFLLTSPPPPVEILPTNAGQDIAPTQSAEVDECQINPYICGQGICYNTAESYTCHCDQGYRLDDTTVSVTSGPMACSGPRAFLAGSCSGNPDGFTSALLRKWISQTSGRWHRLLPLQKSPTRLPDQTGINKRKIDVDECEDRTACPSGICHNEPGSFSCGSCPDGFLGKDGQCVGKFSSDVDECQDERVCIRGHCQNTRGSFFCRCGPGFRVSPAGDQCDDVNECEEQNRVCGDVGDCINNLGSYTCTCPEGYRQVNGTSCRDVDECVEEAELCHPHGRCVNTEGSYQCQHFGLFSALWVSDIDECGLNETRCGLHGFCENRLGSFQCVCDQGYQASQDEKSCEDVNECELLSSVCGEAECVNVDGTFLCVCPSGQDYNFMTAKCESIPKAPPVERKECYYNLNDENLCESVLTSHVTLQECCCTLGAGWGDNCEVYPCPVNGFIQMELERGSNTAYSQISLWMLSDADECSLFGQEVCKGGYCKNTEGSYECYCMGGHYYDPISLECRDINECLDEMLCDGGECQNTDGSYVCMCRHPLVLEPDSHRCVPVPELAEMEQVDYQGICWQTVTQSLTCTRPLGPNRRTTYTECCCRHGEAWGMDCALCPPRESDDYASMCNIPLGGGRRPYGNDALVAGPVHEYEVSPDYLPSPEQQLVPKFYENEEYPYRAFEGLQADECGILNGCENGRCVRVQEGYTCDCFDGYTLDLSRMSCMDVNECSELNNRMSLCRNAKCINTVGSYQCVCLPGFKVSDKPNYCVEAETHQARTQ
uniref:Latent transforming growth factor beta binding protein 1 n=1 Tax=Nothobranchius furzeri TaxID=105023 RepID=A0A8C6KFQ4_NOTFU